MIDKTGAQLMAEITGEEPEEWETDWKGYDLILDLYRLRYADKLALRWISEERLKAYRTLFEAARRSTKSDELVVRIREIADIFECFLHGEPSENFTIDLENDEIRVP